MQYNISANEDNENIQNQIEKGIRHIIEKFYTTRNLNYLDHFCSLVSKCDSDQFFSSYLIVKELAFSKHLINLLVHSLPIDNGIKLHQVSKLINILVLCTDSWTLFSIELFENQEFKSILKYLLLPNNFKIPAENLIFIILNMSFANAEQSGSFCLNFQHDYIINFLKKESCGKHKLHSILALMMIFPIEEFNEIEDLILSILPQFLDLFKKTVSNKHDSGVRLSETLIELDRFIQWDKSYQILTKDTKVQDLLESIVNSEKDKFYHSVVKKLLSKLIHHN